MVKGVAVAYEALPVAADFESVRADVERHLPLRNLHWVRKSSANRTIRTIQTLPVQVRPREAFDGATDLLDMPYANLLFVVCDDNEVYRATLRTQIREWLDSITAKRHQEWLIVHVTSGRGSGGKFYQRKGTIVDKIKADFNVGKRDRCIQVVQGASAEDPTAWADFLTKMKECIVTTFDANVALYEENIRKADSQRMLAGWQFLPFCRQKEALADSFEAMTLYEDALIQYDELEASFFQHVKEHNDAVWLERFGGLAPGDDALPLLSTSSKPYRKLIDTNTITVFDFRIYLFARQAFMLFHLDRVVEVARRGAYFVSTFARKLRENRATLGLNFVESWTYSACLDIVAACEAKLASQAIHTLSMPLLAVKAELLELAKKQLDKLGIFAGHLPALHPFSMSLNEYSYGSVSSTPASSAMTSPTRPPVSRIDLLEAIEKQEVFDRLYLDLTQRAAQAYQSTSRKRCAAKLHACLAALDHERSRHAAAQRVLAQLSGQYTEQKWTDLEAYQHLRAAELQASLEMPREQLLSTLALVRAGVPAGAQAWSLASVQEDSANSVEQNASLAKKLMADVHTLSSALTKDFAAVSFPTFRISLQKDSGGHPSDEDGVTAIALIQNLLPCDLKVDEVRLKFATAEGEQVWLTAGAATLRANESTSVSVFCPTSVTGSVFLELSQLRFSRIIFQYSHRVKLGDETALPPRLPQSLYLPPDFAAVAITLEEPRIVHLDREREIVVCVDSGRNQVNRISIRLSDRAQKVAFDAARAQGVGASVNLAREDDSIVMRNLPAYTSTRIRVPISGDISRPDFEIDVSADYSTAKRPSLRRTIRRTAAYTITLPLAINVQDYFRRDCLLSKFSITTDGTKGLVIQSAVIEAPDQVEVKACRKDPHLSVAVSPLQTANFLFKLTCANPAAIEDPLRLVLRYVSTEQRLRARIKQVIVSTFGEEPWNSCRRWVGDALLADAAAQSEPTPATFDERLWLQRARVTTSTPLLTGYIAELLQKLRRAERETYSESVSAANNVWHGLEIPLELPALSVLNLVSIETNRQRVELGQPVLATVHIRSTFRWTPGSEIEHSRPRLSYTVVYDQQDWIVAGPTRGTFQAHEDAVENFEISLLPLKHGSLFLPSLAIQALSQDDGVSTGIISCETQPVTAATTVEVLPVHHRTTFELSAAPSEAYFV